MKKLDCFHSAHNPAGSAQSSRFGCKSRIAVISGLLVGSLLAVGCSKEKSTTANSETQTSQNQATLNQPVLNQPMTPAPPVAASTTTAVPAGTAKKVVKKRASNVTYKDQTYGLSFRY